MLLTYKYRLKDRSAKKQLRDHAYAVNQVWNYCAAQQRDTEARYRSGAKPRRWASHFDLQKLCKGVGRELGLHQQSVGGICRDFAKARDKIKHAPRFRASFGTKRALGWIPFEGQSRQIDGNSITYLGKRYRWFGNKRRPLPETAKGGAFVEDALGRWWVCFHVQVADREVTGSGEIGIDLGLKTLATLSDPCAPKIENLRHRATWAQRLAKAQRARNKRRVAAIHAKIANARKDHLHKITTTLARSNALIAVGNVNAKRLARTRMAKSVLDAGWSTFRAFLRYKAPGYVEVDERFTTQACSCCGSISGSSPKGMGALGIREWRCDDCGETHDRDVNAARNILALALSAQRRGDESRLNTKACSRVC
ncbi:MAG: transposase [Bradyrhizobium sp.]|nr:transposase [Bradyrhizobium sp.]